MTHKQIRDIIGAVLVIAVSGLLISFILKSKDEPKPSPVNDAKRAVQIDTVVYADITTHVTGTGRVASQQQVDLIAEVQGKLLNGNVHLKKGENFRQGELIAQIYDKDASYALQSRKSMFLTSLANLLPDLKIDYPTSFKKWDAFFQSIEIQKELPELPSIESKQEKIFLSAKGILAEYYGIKSDEVRLKKYKIHAPFSGSFTQVYLEIGSVANPGSRIASIIKTSDMEIEVPLETQDAEWIRIGDDAIIFNDNSSKQIKGTVSRKSAFVDPATQSFNIFVRIHASSNFPVFNGQYLKVKFPGKQLDHAMEIPRGAVFNFDNVFTIDSGYLKINTINIRKINEQTIIFDGLPENKLLVVEPLANATENTAVQIRK